MTLIKLSSDFYPEHMFTSIYVNKRSKFPEQIICYLCHYAVMVTRTSIFRAPYQI